MKSTRGIDIAMANKYADTKATGRFVVEDYVKDRDARKAIAKKYDFSFFKSLGFEAVIDGKSYYVMIEKVLIHLKDRE